MINKQKVNQKHNQKLKHKKIFDYFTFFFYRFANSTSIKLYIFEIAHLYQQVAVCKYK